MWTIDPKKVPLAKDNDVFGPYTSRERVRKVLRRSPCVNHVEYAEGNIARVEMQSGDWLTVPRDALVGTPTGGKA